ncbi:MAG TPA: maleylpyruvate isomerase N-terminal domain-containing protein [Pseudonocardiaceae bacterium]|nr:maleylpyruvate isomerase N-terminal domain-containing protein [Pseudonocardiaceae bacterium]
MGDVDLGGLYCLVRERLVGVVGGVDSPHEVAVPACPGWSVQDVIVHLVAVAEDVLAGRLSAPPTDEWTAAQVAARRDQSMADVLAAWDDVGPRFQELISRVGMWPAFLDVLSHEHDVRGALGAPAGRDAAELVLAAENLISWLRSPVPMTVRVGARELRVGPDGDGSLELVTSPFEAFRFRMGRRSRGQLVAMEWVGDPAPVLDRLTIFGPARADVIE